MGYPGDRVRADVFGLEPRKNEVGGGAWKVRPISSGQKDNYSVGSVLAGIDRGKY